MSGGCVALGDGGGVERFIKSKNCVTDVGGVALGDGGGVERPIKLMFCMAMGGVWSVELRVW